MENILFFKRVRRLLLKNNIVTETKEAVEMFQVEED